MEIMTTKITTQRTLYVHLVLNGVIFGQILYDIVKYARDFLPVKFSFKFYLNKLFFLLPQSVTWPDRWTTCVVTTNTGINGVRLTHHISFVRTVTYFFIVFFETVLCRENSKKVSEKFIGNRSGAWVQILTILKQTWRRPDFSTSFDFRSNRH